MNLSFNNKKITGILTVVPSNEVLFEDEIDQYNFTETQSLRLKKVMGYNKKRIVKNKTTCSSDLCFFGLDYLLENNYINKNEIDALIFISQTPDYLMPPTSNLIHKHLGLGCDVVCFDINQGCAGFILGLFEAFMLLEQKSIKKVVLFNADVLSSKVSKRDRNSNPLIGDASSITIVEKTQEDSRIDGIIKMDGSGAFSLHIPAGGSRIPITPDTGILEIDSEGNFRSKNDLIMKGDEVYNFVLSKIPSLIEDVLKLSSKNKDDIDYYLFHQPNKFMLDKLSDKMCLNKYKVFSNIVENFGNSSGASIPTTICHNLGNLLKDDSFSVCLSGFGVGLTWGAFVMDLGNLNFCEIINYDE